MDVHCNGVGRCSSGIKIRSFRHLSLAKSLREKTVPHPLVVFRFVLVSQNHRITE